MTATSTTRSFHPEVRKKQEQTRQQERGGPERLDEAEEDLTSRSYRSEVIDIGVVKAQLADRRCHQRLDDQYGVRGGVPLSKLERDETPRSAGSGDSPSLKGPATGLENIDEGP